MTNGEKLAIVLIVVGALTRLLPHPPNMTAITGVTVFGAHALRSPILGALVPLLAMALADVVLGWHSSMLWTYGGMLLAFGAAWLLLRRLTIPRLTAATLGASAVFFVVSNLGVFAGGYYGYSVDGLVACFVAALPFWHNSLISDVVSTTAIFGIYLLVSRAAFAAEPHTESMTTPTLKRSEVNRIMREADQFIRSFGYILPPFAYWTPKEFKERKGEAGAIINANLGWDITDYGLGKYYDEGLFLFTVRNGNANDLPKGRGMLYAEKAMISRNEQYSPMHRHNIKAEDIINRGGGTLVIELYGDTGGKCDKSKGVEVFCDGIKHVLPPGGKLQLKPGESVTLMPNEHWHAFWGEGGDVFIGEVSTVNDDNTDNVFDDPAVARFGGIDEDEEPWHLLVSDYGKWLA